MKLPFWGFRLSLVAGIVFLFSLPSIQSAETLQCVICLENYQEQNKLATFTVAVRCGETLCNAEKYIIKSSNDNEEVTPKADSLAANFPFLLGLTTTTATPVDFLDSGYNDKGVEYDFALQPFMLETTSKNLEFTFHAQISDIAGMHYVVAKAWSSSFLQHCSDGRSGCKKFGYSLAQPPSCITKDADGYDTGRDAPECTSSDFYLFKFR